MCNAVNVIEPLVYIINITEYKQRTLNIMDKIIPGAVRMINVEGFASITGHKIQTVYSMIHYKQFPEKYKMLISIGRSRRFILENVNKWILDGAPVKPRKIK